MVLTSRNEHSNNSVDFLAFFLLLNLSVLLIQYCVIESASGLSYIGKVTLSEPILENSNGQRTESIRMGDQGIIVVSVTNNIEEEQPFVLVVEVRDSTGISQFFAMHSGVADPWQIGPVDNTEYEFQTVWTPTEFCHDSDPRCSNFYEVRTFAISDFEEAEVLSIVKSFQGIEVTNPSE